MEKINRISIDVEPLETAKVADFLERNWAKFAEGERAAKIIAALMQAFNHAINIADMSDEKFLIECIQESESLRGAIQTCQEVFLAVLYEEGVDVEKAIKKGAESEKVCKGS